VPKGAGPPGEQPSYAAIANKQNRRVDLLQCFYARGVIEIDWIDEAGNRHTDQGDLDFWVDAPGCMALRVGKLGEDLLWLGCNAEHYWLFDLTDDDEPILIVGRLQNFSQDMTGQPLAVAPWSLLDLLGLAAVPDPASADAPEVTWSAQHDAWVIENASVRTYFERGTLLPVHVELLDDDGATQASGEHYLRRYKSVDQPEMSVLDWPKLTTLTDVYDAQREQRIKFALDEPTGLVEGEPFDRICDLDRLIKAFRPKRVEDNR
jgi:hypothetical protein